MLNCKIFQDYVKKNINNQDLISYSFKLYINLMINNTFSLEKIILLLLLKSYIYTFNLLFHDNEEISKLS